MKPFAEVIGPVKVGFGPEPYPRLTVFGVDPEQEGRPSSTAEVVLDRGQATDLRDWLSEFLEDGGS